MRHSLAVDPFEVEAKNASAGEGAGTEGVTCGRVRDDSLRRSRPAVLSKPTPSRANPSGSVTGDDPLRFRPGTVLPLLAPILVCEKLEDIATDW